MFPNNDFGHFIDHNRAYRVTTPLPPAILTNVITNDSGWQTEITHWGTESIFIKYPDLDMKCTVVNRERIVLLYCRDEDTGEVWNPGFYPMMKPLEAFSCEHHDGWSVLESVYSGIKVTYRKFVPRFGYREIWTLSVENLTDKPRRISVVPVITPRLDGFPVPRMFESSLATCEFCEDLNGLLYMNNNPNVPWKARGLAFAGSIQPAEFCANRKHFFGVPNALNYPQLLLSGKPLGNTTIGNVIFEKGALCSLRFEIGLDPGAGRNFHMLLAAVADLDEARQIKEAMFADGEVEKEFDATVKAIAQRRANLVISTPDPKVDAFVNTWLKRGLEYCIVEKDATRDNFQFTDGMVMSDPDRARKELLRILKYQYADGHAMRSWVPLDEHIYGDKPIWIVMATCGYVKFSDDKAFLDIKVPYFDEGEGTVLEHLEKAVQWIDTHRGPNGLPLIFYADWNDAMNLADQQAESVFIAMGLGFMLKEMAALMRYLGDEDKAAEYEKSMPKRRSSSTT